MSETIGFRVNGEEVSVEASATTRLCETLRETLNLVATHIGCSEGVCGTCTVLLDGKPVRACLLLAAQCEGAHIETVEGITPLAGLGAVQAALVESNAIQCGFCTPGFVILLEALRRNEAARGWSDDTLKKYLSGVACRCTGYLPVLRAARRLLAEPAP